MIRVLSIAETAEFLAANPIDAAEIPTWGLRVTWNGKDYLVGLNHNTGEIKVMDATTYDPESGQRIDPAIADQSQVELYFHSILSGVADSAKQILDWTPLFLLAGAVLLGIYVWGERKHGPAR